MLLNRLSILATIVLCASCASREPRIAARTVTYFGAPPGALQRVKARLESGDKTLQPALERLVADAQEALRVVPPTVLDNPATPPSGDEHDYMSLAPYFWPDPANSNGLPYIRRDGETNPTSHGATSDRNRIGLMARTVETLGLAYYFTGNEAYAAHAARCLRTWFLNPATRMNPNLNFAQAIVGLNTGRGIGVIEGRTISEAADAAQLLEGSRSWSAADDSDLKAWLAQYLHWLLTSKNGREEAAAKNNHGTLYDVQAIRLALVLGKRDLARQIAEAARQKRIAVQIQPDGRQPLELVRATSFSYSRFNIDALLRLATLSEHVGVDLWHFETADGRSIRKALDYLVQFVGPSKKPWPLKQIKGFGGGEMTPALYQAAIVYQEPKYRALAESLGDSPERRYHLLFPSQ